MLYTYMSAEACCFIHLIFYRLLSFVSNAMYPFCHNQMNNLWPKQNNIVVEKFE